MIIENNLWIFFIYTLILSLLSHRFFVIRSEKYQIKKVNISAERWSSQSKPVLGGITFYAIFIFSIINYIIFFGYENLLQGPVFGTILVVTISFLMGLADDMLNTPPGFKFMVQFLSAAILIYSGICIQTFDSKFLNYAITTFWIVGMMNSLNMLDNMDAITTTVSSTILIGAIVVLSAISGSNSVFLLISIGALASLISFLYYNWNPSKMYMGDNGSQFLGSLLAIIGIEAFWNTPAVNNYSFVYPLVIAVAVFIVPISDTATVTINRLLRGQSPFVGGRDHTTHHLSYFGLKDSHVALILLSINAIFVAFISFAILSDKEISRVLIITGILALIVFITLYTITKISKPKQS